MKIYFFSLVLILLFFTSCFQPKKNIFVLQINEHELSHSFKKTFPIEKDFILGSLILKDPSIKIYKNQNRIKTQVELRLKTLFINPIKGGFSISAEPFLKRKEKAIYLKKVKLESFHFGRLKMSPEFSKIFVVSLEPMINELFIKYPIYKIPKNSSFGSFIKDIKVENSKLLISYGI